MPGKLPDFSDDQLRDGGQVGVEQAEELRRDGAQDVGGGACPGPPTGRRRPAKLGSTAWRTNGAEQILLCREVEIDRCPCRCRRRRQRPPASWRQNRGRRTGGARLRRSPRDGLPCGGHDGDGAGRVGGRRLAWPVITDRSVSSQAQRSPGVLSMPTPMIRLLAMPPSPTCRSRGPEPCAVRRPVGNPSSNGNANQVAIAATPLSKAPPAAAARDDAHPPSSRVRAQR